MIAPARPIAPVPLHARACTLLLAALVMFPGCFSCIGPGPCPEGQLSEDCDSSHVNTRGWEDSPFLSADGQRLYFMYSRYNFFPIFRASLPEKRGPMRPGYVEGADNPFDEAGTYLARRTDSGGWTAPEPLALNAQGTACCLMTNDERRYYYQRGQEDRATDLFVVAMNADGSPGAPENLGEANSKSLEDNPHASVDDQTVWFTSSRSGGRGGKDLWVTRRREDKSWGPAENLGPAFNSPDDEDQIWVRPDGKVAYFNRGMRILRTENVDGVWGPATEVSFEGGPVEGAEASLNANEDTMILAVVDRDRDDIVICQSQRQPDGSFSRPVPVD